MVCSENLKKYLISSDGGNTLTEQYLTYFDAANEVLMGHIVKQTGTQKSEVDEE